MKTHEIHVVVGGTGRAGRAVVQALLAHGKSVRVINRSGQADFPAAVEVQRADLFDAASTRTALQGASIVYNCSNPIQYSSAAWAHDFPLLWANITAATAATGAKLVVADNLYMYGPHAGPLTEETPYRAISSKGQTRIRMAEELMAAHERGELQVAVGRAGDFYGPHCEFMNEQFFNPALAGKPVQGFIALDTAHSLSFIHDVGEGLVTLGEHDQAFGEIWHLPVAPAVTQRELIATIFEEVGVEPQISVLPLEVLQKVGEQNEIVRELLDNAYQFEQPFVVGSSKFERAFGVAATPLRAGIRQSLAWLREQEPAVAH